MNFDRHVEAVRRWETKVRALVEWDEAAARRRLESACAGPLQGWAVGIKDIIDVTGLPTRCNVDFLPPQPASADAALVALLQSAGAFVMAKTVTTSFAYFDPGPTRNPWNLEHTPGGSSSGSAAAVACGMVRLAVGTQTVGSINRPAAYCGVVGFKPTFATFPVGGVFPFSPSFDTVGFFTQGVSDLETAFTTLLKRSPASSPIEFRAGMVADLGVEPADPEQLEVLERAAQALIQAGWEIRPVSLPPWVTQVLENHWTLVSVEAAAVHERLFERYGRFYPPRLAELIGRGRVVASSEIDSIRAHQETVRSRLAELISEVEWLLTPCAPGPAPRGIAATGDPRFNILGSYAGFPALTLPVGLSTQGLPLAIQVIGGPGRDLDLLACARAAERVLGWPGAGAFQQMSPTDDN